jgi:hypothetical protein
VRPARKADNCAVLVLPNVKVRLEAQHAIHPPSLHACYVKAIPRLITCETACMSLNLGVGFNLTCRISILYGNFFFDY